MIRMKFNRLRWLGVVVAVLLCLPVVVFFFHYISYLYADTSFERIPTGSKMDRVKAMLLGFSEHHVSVMGVPKAWRHQIPRTGSFTIVRYRLLSPDNDIYVVYDVRGRVAYKIPAYE